MGVAVLNPEPVQEGERRGKDQGGEGGGGGEGACGPGGREEEGVDG